MSLLLDLPIWAIALLIFGMRILDVSLGTLRTISVVQGRIRLSVLLGFFEVLIWVIGVSQVMAGFDRSPLLPVAYAGGFAAGNGVGIAIEKRLALGSVVVRMISTAYGDRIAETLRIQGYRLTSFPGQGRNGPVTLLFITCKRREAPRIIQTARAQDPTLFYTIEPIRERSVELLSPLPQTTGWRAFLKKK
ncbi:DUF2179 domain-containing protein [Tautonia sociabilis]|uniref:DUF2179 domain-containing protein n=1 Tax=Tautonia sociabilis TaxID=2080755 RepID=A0A432MGY7_9BACT|nr:DUF5698 domain-containing protein [Tautonia sociabilis]RUL85939.1 DUF2179 domain-containing protein [Tautonia sociabilis]